MSNLDSQEFDSIPDDADISDRATERDFARICAAESVPIYGGFDEGDTWRWETHPIGFEDQFIYQAMPLDYASEPLPGDVDVDQIFYPPNYNVDQYQQERNRQAEQHDYDVLEP